MGGACVDKLFFSFWRSGFNLFLCFAGFCTVAGAAQAETIPHQPLPHLALNPQTITVSGFSSGAFMAVQMHVAHSSLIKGIAVFAGGPFGCARDQDGIATLAQATQHCVNVPYLPWWKSFGTFANPPLLSNLEATVHALERANRIDALHNLAQDRVVLFSGTRDPIVPLSVMKVLNKWYTSFIPEHQIHSVFTTQAGHGLPSLEGTVACPDTDTPYLNSCGIDGVGQALPFLLKPYGSTTHEKSHKGGELFSFSQLPFLPHQNESAGMNDVGYVFVPKMCEKAPGCHLHIAFHGCKQNDAFTGLSFFTKSGYNTWAEQHGTVVLYPQVRASFPENSLGCWDWWGYTDQDFLTREGQQIQSVHAMITRLLTPL